VSDAAGHASARVPVASSRDGVDAVRARLIGRQFDCATHVVVCEDNRLAGLLRIEAIWISLLVATAGIFVPAGN
jgi:hypothetical protein